MTSASVSTNIPRFNIPSTELGTAFTISIWMYIPTGFTTIGTNPVIFNLKGSTLSIYMYFPSVSRLLAASVESGNTGISSTAFSLDTWYNIIWVINAGTWTIYVSAATFNSMTGSPFTQTGKVTPSIQNRIGSFGGNASSDSLQGAYFDDFRIYNYALTAADAQNVYNNNLQ